MIYYGKFSKYTLSLVLCCMIFIYPHVDTGFWIRKFFDFSSKSEINYCKRKTLNVAFHFNIIPVDAGGEIMEYDWITNVLLGKIDRPLKILMKDEAEKWPLNDTLHVFLMHPPRLDMFKRLRQDGYVNQGAFHMGDNLMDNNISYYPDATYVFRNKYNADYLSNYTNVHFAPLGTKSGFGTIPTNTILPSTQRKYVINFIGTIRANREDMIMKVQKLNVSSFFFYNNFTYGSKRGGLHVIYYRNILRESVFTLAPWGTSPESMRMYEALEAGSIPIIQRYYTHLSPITPMGRKNPIPQFYNWGYAIKFIEEMSKNLTKVDVLQKKIIEFWKDYKIFVQEKFKDVIDQAFDTSHKCS